MSLKRVCEMEFRYNIPPEPLWGCLLDTMTRLSNMTPSDIVSTFIEPNPPTHDQQKLLQHMTIVSVYLEGKLLKQRFTISVFFEGYKLINATTRVRMRSGNPPSSIVDCSVEYEKSGPEFKDLEVVEIMKKHLNDIAYHTGYWEAHIKPSGK